MPSFVAPASDYLLTIALTVIWLILWRARRPTRMWFVALLPPALALLTWPAGALVDRIETTELFCEFPDIGCETHGIYVALNGYLGLLVSLALLAVTLMIEAVLATIRYVWHKPDHTPGGGAQIEPGDNPEMG